MTSASDAIFEPGHALIAFDPRIVWIICDASVDGGYAIVAMQPAA